MKKPLALLLVAPLATTTLALAQAPAASAEPASPSEQTAPAAPERGAWRLRDRCRASVRAVSSSAWSSTSSDRST